MSAQLLKTMKQALLKQTADEVKQFRPDRATPTKLAHKPNYRPQRKDNAKENADISRLCTYTLYFALLMAPPIMHNSFKIQY